LKILREGQRRKSKKIRKKKKTGGLKRSVKRGTWGKFIKKTRGSAKILGTKLGLRTSLKGNSLNGKGGDRKKD